MIKVNMIYIEYDNHFSGMGGRSNLIISDFVLILSPKEETFGTDSLTLFFLLINAKTVSIDCLEHKTKLFIIALDSFSKSKKSTKYLGILSS